MSYWLIAIIWAESAFNPTAVSSANAKGLLQLTPIGTKEASIQCKLDPNPDLFHWDTNLTYGKCLLYFYLKQAKGDKLGANVLFNGGYRAYRRYKAGKTLNKETLDYIYKIYYKEKELKNERITINLDAKLIDYGKLWQNIETEPFKDTAYYRRHWEERYKAGQQGIEFVREIKETNLLGD